MGQHNVGFGQPIHVVVWRTGDEFEHKFAFSIPAVKMKGFSPDSEQLEKDLRHCFRAWYRNALRSDNTDEFFIWRDSQSKVDQEVGELCDRPDAAEHFILQAMVDLTNPSDPKISVICGKNLLPDKSPGELTERQLVLTHARVPVST